MQSIQEFIQKFFLTRIEEEKRILADRAKYRQEFFASNCLWDSRTYTLAMLESERILDIKSSDVAAAVITEFKAPPCPVGSQTQRNRYCLKKDADRWLIQDVEHQCPFCEGKGDESCLACKGNHWLRKGMPWQVSVKAS